MAKAEKKKSDSSSSVAVTQVNSLIKCFLERHNFTSYYDAISRRDYGNLFISDVKHADSRMYLDIVYKAKGVEIDVRDKWDQAEIILNVTGLAESILGTLEGKLLKDFISLSDVNLRRHRIEKADRHPRGILLIVKTQTVNL
jgi:hypothetical protein